MSTIATWYACRQNIEFWRNSDLGFTCGAFNSQIIEFSIWFHKRMHYLHSNGSWDQIDRMLSLVVAGTEGALKHNIPDFIKIAKQHKDEREKWWNNHSTMIEINNVLSHFSGLHQYFIKLLRKVKPCQRLPRRILSIVNTNKNAVTNVHLQKHLAQLGYRHSVWSSDRIVINGNENEDINEYRPENDSGDSNDEDYSDDSDDNEDSDDSDDTDNDNDSDYSDNEASVVDNNDDNDQNNNNDNIDDRFVNIRSELLTTTDRRCRFQLVRLAKITQKRHVRNNNNNNDNDNDSDYDSQRGENDQ